MPELAAQATAPRAFTAVDLAGALTVVLIWGLNFIVGKVGLTELPPLLMIGLRFALVALLLAPFLRPMRGRWRLIVALSVVLGGLHFGLMFVGLSGVNAGPAAVAIQLTVPFSAILAWLFHRERLGAWQLLGMAVAFAGVWLLAGEPTHPPDPLHFALVVAGAFAWSCANLLIKRLGPINPMTLNGWMGLLAFPQLLVASALLEHGQWTAIAAAGWRAWGAVAYTAVAASIIAYGLWYRLIERHALNRVVPLTLLSPVLAVGLAALVLSEPITPRILVGGAAVIVGVAMIQFLRSSTEPCGAT